MSELDPRKAFASGDRRNTSVLGRYTQETCGISDAREAIRARFIRGACVVHSASGRAAVTGSELFAHVT
jgi:hypothetical protein